MAKVLELRQRAFSTDDEYINTLKWLIDYAQRQITSYTKKGDAKQVFLMQSIIAKCKKSLEWEKGDNND